MLRYLVCHKLLLLPQAAVMSQTAFVVGQIAGAEAVRLSL
jgi:hypothetical protein